VRWEVTKTTVYQYTPADRRMRIPCTVKDGSDVVFDLMDGGMVNVQTSHGHYVAIDHKDLKALVLFLMGHIIPDTNVEPRT